MYDCTILPASSVPLWPTEVLILNRVSVCSKFTIIVQSAVVPSEFSGTATIYSCLVGQGPLKSVCLATAVANSNAVVKAFISNFILNLIKVNYFATLLKRPTVSSSFELEILSKQYLGPLSELLQSLESHSSRFLLGSHRQALRTRSRSLLLPRA